MRVDFDFGLVALQGPAKRLAMVADISDRVLRRANAQCARGRLTLIMTLRYTASRDVLKQRLGVFDARCDRALSA